MASVAELRAWLEHEPEPFEWRVITGEDDLAAVAAARLARDLAAAELAAAQDGPQRARLADGPRGPRLAELRERLASADARVDEAVAGADSALCLRWLPLAPDAVDALVVQMRRERPRLTAGEWEHALVSRSFIGAYTTDGELVSDDWPTVAAALPPRDLRLATAGAVGLHEHVQGSPFRLASSGRPATSSTPA